MLADAGPDARPLAGGTDLWPNMKRRHQVPRTLVSLMGIAELREVRPGPELRIGATATLRDVVAASSVRERYPALAEAAASVSSPPLRNMATLGGNLCVDTRCTYYNQTESWRRAIDYCLKKDGDVCWVAPGSSKCWAHAASDTAPMLCALDARVRIVSEGGERVLRAEDLFRDDGIDYLALRPDEILAEVLLPESSDRAHCRSAFRKLRRRGSIDFSVLSVGAAVWTDDAGRVERARIALGAVAPRPVLAREAAESLIGERLSESAIARAARLARGVATPLDNTDFQPAWRGVMAERHTAAALSEAAARIA